MAEPIGYTNPGGDESKIEPVFELTSIEQAQQALLVELEVEISMAEDARDEVLNACTHRVFEDVPGVPYDLRRCLICRRVVCTV
jgi:hypothetical protein